MDKDCVAMLKKKYGGDNDSTKQDLMEYGDLLTNFFGREEKGKEVLEAVDDYIWDMLGWISLYLQTKEDNWHVWNLMSNRVCQIWIHFYGHIGKNIIGNFGVIHKDHN